MPEKQVTIETFPEFVGLKPMQIAFVEHLVADPNRNRTKAALKAGLTDNASSAAVIGRRLFKTVKIQEAIRALEVWVRSEDELLPRMVARLKQLAFEDRYVLESPDQPALPGLEDAVYCQVKHADAISAIKELSRICGVGAPERHELTLVGDRLERAFNGGVERP